MDLSQSIAVEPTSPVQDTSSAATVARLSHGVTARGSPPKHRLDSRLEREGKRWVRRKDNSRFATNPHIVKPTTKDFGVYTPSPRPTFPKPLPPFLPRLLSAPSASAPSRDPSSANAGRYSLSLKGVRRELRRSGPRSEQIVLDIEHELVQWLHSGGIVLCPDSYPAPMSSGLGKPLGKSNSIHELCRTPTELVWRIDEDFPRYILHCVARFHGIVSFSKTGHGDIRVTHLLRPNVTRPDFMAPDALNTPPASDSDMFSVIVDTEGSDATSEQEQSLESDGGDAQYPPASGFLLEERDGTVPSGSQHQRISQDETDSSVDEEHEDLSLSIDSLTLTVDNCDWEETPRRRGPRADSSSCSPSRPARRARRVSRGPLTLKGNQLEFWQYVFA